MSLTPLPKRIVVLVSGSGSNLQAIIDECTAGNINGNVVGVISNVPKVYALERARKSNIQSFVVNHRQFSCRQDFDDALADKVNDLSPDLIVLAGFMRILHKSFVKQFYGKMLNIHPSLLPKYPGLHTHAKVIENQDAQHGASVHFVSAELDGGPIVVQSVINVDVNDSPKSLHTRLARTEWLIYPLVLKWFCQDALRLKQDKVWFKKSLSSAGPLNEKSADCKIRINNLKEQRNDEDKY